MQTENGHEVNLKPFATPDLEHCVNLNFTWCPNGHWVDMVFKLTEAEADWLRLCLESAVRLKREHVAAEIRKRKGLE